MHLRHALALALFLAAPIAAPLAGCTKNEATGKNILTLGMSRDKEIALGAQAAPEFTKEYGGAVPDASLQQYVTDIGSRMARETEAQNPSLPWEFTLLNTPVVNAFALPGGKVFFTRGLAEQLTTEAQMAGVIGHEIGHVTARHGAQRIASQTAFNVGLVVTAIAVGVSGNDTARDIGAVGVPALAIGGNLVLLKYGRDEELEADRLGVRYMTNVGYNPRGQMEVMQVLSRLSQGASQPAFLSTHPDPNARVESIRRMLDGEYQFTQGNPNYQDFADRYKSQFLDVIKRIPPAPKPQNAARDGAHPINLDDPTSWCGHCAAAAHHDAPAGSSTFSQSPETRPVPPREGVYAFFAPPAGQQAAR